MVVRDFDGILFWLVEILGKVVSFNAVCVGMCTLGGRFEWDFINTFINLDQSTRKHKLLNSASRQVFKDLISHFDRVKVYLTPRHILGCLAPHEFYRNLLISLRIFFQRQKVQHQLYKIRRFSQYFLCSNFKSNLFYFLFKIKNPFHECSALPLT